MAEILKERSELDPQFQWDLTPMFESDAAWETALENLDAEIDSVAAFAGKLSDAITIGAYLDATTELNRKVEQPLLLRQPCATMRTPAATSCPEYVRPHQQQVRQAGSPRCPSPSRRSWPCPRRP